MTTNRHKIKLRNSVTHNNCRPQKIEITFKVEHFCNYMKLRNHFAHERVDAHKLVVRLRTQ